MPVTPSRVPSSSTRFPLLQTNVTRCTSRVQNEIDRELQLNIQLEEVGLCVVERHQAPVSVASVPNSNLQAVEG
jgi:hypothetical protein